MKAFPTTNWQTTAPLCTGYDEGMNLRDYFAAKAMQSLIPVTQKAIAEELVTPKSLVDSAYQWADLMIKARDE